ncbi:MAG: carboxypeptidase regulatory-like domain-containing protein, partial [Bryobacteraceae bacterium]
MRVFLALWATVPLAAQVTTGMISGYVFDPSRRPVSGALVTARQKERGLERTARTDSSGLYVLAGLVPALYDVAATAPNFEAAGAPVEVTVDSRRRADFHLVVAGVRQSVDVPATVPLVMSGSAELGAVLDRARIESLPLNRRDFLQLALLAPGVLPPVQDSELSGRGSFAMHAAGAREEFNNYLIDGVDNNDAYVNTFSLQPPVDAIQEFKIAVSAYSAEYGRGGGGQVNVITRGGSNAFHGSLYEYLRNRVVDARNFFDGPERPKYIRNQFGAAAGGAAAPDRTFWFASFDSLRERRGLARLAAVPGAAERSGDFSA